ncbi:hypothetical protein N7495_006092 [Penicillium taxi]|uniref:uncharacterized protein n=1 Tax=Penicillium taxi TaxID=168475 RepID=UPI00254549BA|nr:uncharacterized protein N7495_006092 [Penicillium taxi]KAJ5894401.1 hypothetical protein N7495_006092 [Penicillium taxi]
MGNSQSTLSKDERRCNRLSKPLTKKKLAALSSPVLPSPNDPQELSSGLIGWQNPWVGSSISESGRSNYPRRGEIPPTVYETEPVSPGQSIAETPTPGSIHNINDLNWEPPSPNSRSFSFTRSARRPSTGYSEPLRRANSFQANQKHQSRIYENPDAAASNTHFLVGNQRFSLTRRRSLLTRPGVATRRTAGQIPLLPSSLGDYADEFVESDALQWPLPPRQKSLPAAPHIRPSSPTDTQYTQLGALKLGSLRVVNPSPNERTTLEIPVLDTKKQEDYPGSPFSFEKSPIITVPFGSRGFPREVEDEGISMYHDGLIDKIASEDSRRTSQSNNKTDSGYSSAASVCSFQRSQTRGSIDSQASSSVADSGKNVMVLDRFDDKSRHLSQDLNPTTTNRWYDSSDPTTVVGSRSRRSTLCAPRYTEYAAQVPSRPSTGYAEKHIASRYRRPGMAPSLPTIVSPDLINGETDRGYTDPRRSRNQDYRHVRP